MYFVILLIKIPSLSTMSNYIHKINLLEVIIKSIDKGFCKVQPTEYITDIYEVDLITAMEITKLSIEDIKLMKKSITQATDSSEDAIESILKSIPVCTSVINYILDRKTKSYPKDEFIVKIKHDHPNLLGHSKNTLNGYHVGTTKEHTSIFTIKNNKIEKSSHNDIVNTDLNNYPYNSTVNLPCPNNTDYGIIEEFSNIGKVSNFHWFRSNTSQVTFSPVKNQNLIRYWNINEHYDLSDRYLTFHSQLVKIIMQVEQRTYSSGTYQVQKYVIDPSSVKMDKILKIPLVNGLRMRTPLGLVTVKKIQTIDNWESINSWTDEEANNFFAQCESDN